MDSTILPVRLKYASSQFSDTINGVNLKNTYAKVKLQTIGFQRNVIFFYKKSEGIWDGEPLVLDANYGDYELYIAKHIPLTEEFAIKSTVDGISYWDNNNGNNYHLLTSRVHNIMGGNVVLNKAIAKTEPEIGVELENKKSWVEGEIYVTKKGCYYKNIGVRFSADNGITWENVEASYEHPVTESFSIDVALGELEVELWKFKTPACNFNQAADIFRFAVYYHNLETNESYWDNNFEQDYKISKIHGSTIE